MTPPSQCVNGNSKRTSDSWPTPQQLVVPNGRSPSSLAPVETANRTVDLSLSESQIDRAECKLPEPADVLSKRLVECRDVVTTTLEKFRELITEIRQAKFDVEDYDGADDAATNSEVTSLSTSHNQVQIRCGYLSTAPSIQIDYYPAEKRMFPIRATKQARLTALQLGELEESNVVLPKLELSCSDEGKIPFNSLKKFKDEVERWIEDITEIVELDADGRSFRRGVEDKNENFREQLACGIERLLGVSGLLADDDDLATEETSLLKLQELAEEGMAGFTETLRAAEREIEALRGEVQSAEIEHLRASYERHLEEEFYRKYESLDSTALVSLQRRIKQLESLSDSLDRRSKRREGNDATFNESLAMYSFLEGRFNDHRLPAGPVNKELKVQWGQRLAEISEKCPTDLEPEDLRMILNQICNSAAMFYINSLGESFVLSSDIETALAASEVVFNSVTKKNLPGMIGIISNFGSKPVTIDEISNALVRLCRT